MYFGFAIFTKFTKLHIMYSTCIHVCESLPLTPSLSLFLSLSFFLSLSLSLRLEAKRLTGSLEQCKSAVDDLNHKIKLKSKEKGEADKKRDELRKALANSKVHH